MSMKELMDKIKALQTQIRDAANALTAAACDTSVSVADLQTRQSQLSDLQSRAAVLQASYDAQLAAQGGDLGGTPETNLTPAQDRGLREILASREYARAFAASVRNGINPRNGRGREECNILFDALTIGGGTPAGSDGGFLVPEDVDNQIREISRTLSPLAPYFAQENVMSNSGWRVIDAAPAAGMASVNEMGTLAVGEAPKFTKVSYTLTKYAMYLPVSNELLSDEVAGLLAYIARWAAKKDVIQQNTLLTAALATLTATDLAEGEELSGLKTALNVGLDPAIAANATIITNQSGFDVLDNLVDGNGRPLLSDDPTTGAPSILRSRPVVVVSDAILANASSKAPVYIGDGTQFATLFSRNPMEIVSTDVGGDAFRTDSTEVRCIHRMTVTKFDAAAMVKRTLAL